MIPASLALILLAALAVAALAALGLALALGLARTAGDTTAWEIEQGLIDPVTLEPLPQEKNR